MAHLIRLRQTLFQSSSIPKCCSFSPIASDSSHLIILSKTHFPAAPRLENPSIRPTPSKHDRPPPSTSLKSRFLFGPYYRKPETKIPEVEIDFPKFPKPSPEEMIETCFQTLAKMLGSVEEAKVIEEMSDKFKEFALEMIEQLKGACMREKKSGKDTKVVEEMSNKLKKSFLKIAEQLKDMLGFVLVSPDLGIDHENNKFEEEKCENEVTTPRLPSSLTEYEDQLSVEGMEIIDEMPEKLTKYVEVLKKLKDDIEKAKATRMLTERWLSGEMPECIKKKYAGFIDYVKMNTSNMPKESISNKFLPEQISEYSEIVSWSKGKYGDTWKSHTLDIDNFEELVVDLKAIRESIRICRAYSMGTYEEERNGTQLARELQTYRRLKRLEARTQHYTHMPSF